MPLLDMTIITILLLIVVVILKYDLSDEAQKAEQEKIKRLENQQKRNPNDEIKL